MEITTQPTAIRVMGLELRTSNAEAMRTIPAFWQRISEEQTLQRISARLSQDIYAVYTNFEHAGVSNDGLYSLIVGAAVPAIAPLPSGMAHAVLPAGQRAVFDVPGNDRMRVPEAWQQVWQATDLPKAYVADYEVYRADGGIQLFIGLH